MMSLSSLSFLAKSIRGDDQLSHQIRTPLHAITNMAEHLQEIYSIAIIGEKIDVTMLVSQQLEITKALEATTQNIEALTRVTAPPLMIENTKQDTFCYQRQLKQFTAKAHAPLSDLESEMESLQATHQRFSEIAVKHSEIKRNNSNHQLEILIKSIQAHLTAIINHATTLTEIIGTQTSSLESDPEKSNISSSPSTLRLSPRQTKLALVVDDIKINQTLLVKHLERLGIPSKIAINGQEAIDWAKKMKFDIIFMDIDMPVMNGFKATEEIRKLEKAESEEKSDEMESSATPIICVTANADKENEAKAYACGMDAFISKPFKRDHIQDLLIKFTGYQISPRSFDSNSESDSELSVSDQKISLRQCM